MVTQPGLEITWGEAHVGAVQVFGEAGFTEISAPTKRRRVMRVDFQFVAVRPSRVGNGGVWPGRHDGHTPVPPGPGHLRQLPHSLHEVVLCHPGRRYAPFGSSPM